MFWRKPIPTRWILKELQALRQDCSGIRSALEQIAEAIAARNALDHPHIEVHEGQPGAEPVEISFTNDREQLHLMHIELDLTRARGIPPSEEEILEEYQRQREAAR